MKAAIIAAGVGERLAQGGISTPKPLVPIAGEPLISRTIHAAARLGATSVACIVNDVHPEVARYLRSTSWPAPLELVVKTTPSSMESLFQLAPLLFGEAFLLFTVDAVFRLETARDFLSKAAALPPDGHGALALTRFVDDEKPLWVRTGPDRKILALGDAARPTEFITAGFYFFRPEIFAAIEAARARKLTALRAFLSLLVDEGHALYGIPVSKSVDVDHPGDIAKAEEFLREHAEP